jgi:hypothetical protein
MMHRAVSTTLLLTTSALAGCASGGRERFANENDRLRAQAVDLENQVKMLQGRNVELQTQLAEAVRGSSTAPPEVIENTPRVVAISLSRLSQARDENGDDKLDSILLYLEPADGLGRFMQVVGSVSMHAAILPKDEPAITIGQKTIGPKELRDAYRAAFTGQYYSLSMPIEPPAGAEQCTVRVVFTDGYTGQSFSTERAIDLK